MFRAAFLASDLRSYLTFPVGHPLPLLSLAIDGDGWLDGLLDEPLGAVR